MSTADAARRPRSSAARKYIEDEILSLQPVELILKVYDFAIAGCHQEDGDKVGRALVELIAALNFEYRDIAMPLFEVYDYCLRCAKAGDFESIIPVFKELRETWQQVTTECLRQAG